MVLAPQLMAGTTAATAMTIAVLAPLAAIASQRAFGCHAPRLGEPMVIAGLIAGALVCVQAVPLPIGWVDVLYPAAAAVAREAAALLDAPPPSTASLSLAPLATRRELAEGLALLAIVWAAWSASRGGDRIQIVRTCAVAIVAVAVVSLGHAILDVRSPFGLVSEPHWNPAFIGPILNQNQLGALLAAGVPALIVCGLEEQTPSRRWPWMIAAAGVAIMTVFCNSRGAVLSLMVGVSLLVLLMRGRRPGDRRLTVLLVGAASAMMLGAAAFAVVGDAMIAETQRGLPKLDLFRQALDVIATAPWTGVGRGAFSAAFVRLHGSDERPEHPENIAIEWIAELGIPVAIVVLAALLVAIVRAARSGRSPAQLGAIAAVVSLGVHDLFDFALEMVGTGVVGACLLGAALAPSIKLTNQGEQRPRIAPLWIGGVALAVSILVARPVIELAVPRLRDEMLDAMRAGDWARVDELTHRAVLAHPSEPVFPLLAGHAAVAQDRPDALRWLTRAMLLAPEWYQPHEAAARWLARRGAVDQAWLEVREVRRREASRAIPAACLVAARSDSSLIAVRVFPADHALLEAIVACSAPADARRIDEHLAAAGRAGPRIRQARALLQSRDPEGALRALDGAEEDDERVVMVRADALAAAGRHDEAVSVLRERLGAEPTPTIRVRLARAQAAAGNGEAMRLTLQSILETGDGSPGAMVRQRLLLASLEESMGDRMRALEALEQAHSIDPSGPALPQIARVATALGDTLRAQLAHAELCRREGAGGAHCDRDPSGRQSERSGPSGQLSPLP
ncbi:MAG: O-antigen ligase family protein [Myxococcota bacterium]|nr:O-antigen ligase family protein [Myxococcota bacterium]